MAVVARKPVNQRAVPDGPSYQSEPFDINLLCQKLEAAKLEQDAARLQRMQRWSGGSIRDVLPPLDNHRHSLVMPIGTGKPHPNEDTSERRRSVTSKQLFAAFTGGKVENEPRRDNISRTERPKSQYFLRSNTDELDVTSLKSKDSSKRKSLTIDRAVTHDLIPLRVNETTETKAVKDAAKRRSKTFPLLLSKQMLKDKSITTCEYIHSPEVKSPCIDSPDTPMGLENEYTISFDLADIFRDEFSRNADRFTRKKRESQGRADGLRSRSLLNLPLLLKKEKTQVQTEEIDITPDELVAQARPLTAHNGHVRQKSLPIDLVGDTRGQVKKEDRERKRRTFMGFFKKFS